MTNAPSRGDLPTNFLKGTSTPMEYLQSLDPKVCLRIWHTHTAPLRWKIWPLRLKGYGAQEHNGFNLVVGNLESEQVAYLTNRSDTAHAPVMLTPGLYGISNGVLDSKWPKVERGKHTLQVDLCQPQDSLHMNICTYVMSVPAPWH